MNALLSSPASVWIIAAASTLGVITRPFKLPEAVWAVLGAFALCILGMLSWSDALMAIGKGLDVYLFLTGMMVASELARKEGLFGYLAALAAKRVVVTVEEIVDDLRAPPNACVLPQWVVSAVSVVPGGAFPSYALDYYDRDNRFYKAWNNIARERDTFLAWMQRHIVQTADFAEFRRTLGNGGREDQHT